jgi:hypothetical protein
VIGGEATIDPHVLRAILTLLPAVVIVLGIAVCELLPNDREQR